MDYVGGTRVPRVQFGVSPDCVGKRTVEMIRMNNSQLCPHTVSGVTPETTRGTRVLPTAFRALHQCLARLAILAVCR